MSPFQKDDDGQEWEAWTAEHLTEEQRAQILMVPWWAIRDGYSRLALVWAEVDKDAILADHRDAHHLRERVRVLEEALRKRGKCFHCQGTGKPNCVTCDDYQACRCRPGEGRYAERCWNCKGTGLNAWAAALLSPAAATEGGEGA